jgi:DNA-binding transcriptional ArsR family regulator
VDGAEVVAWRFHYTQANLPHMQTLLRSEVSQQLLALLYLDPDIGTAGSTVRQLARRIGTSEATVSREVTRLVQAGAATEERAGNRRIVRQAPEGPLAFHLAGLLRATIGPEVVLRRLLAGRSDIVRAAIFGSYAARAAGEPGPPPRDIDLLLIGDISFEDGYDLAHAASRELGIEINPVIRTFEEWEDDDTGFAAEVRARPTIDLMSPTR